MNRTTDDRKKRRVKNVPREKKFNQDTKPRGLM